MKSVWVALVSIGAMGVAGRMAVDLDRQIHPPQPPPGLDAHESSATSSLLGQFRTNVSSWLWLRTDLYLHNGVQMRPMTEQERREGLETCEARDDGHERLHDESAVTTVIPSAVRDFRGLLGDAERAVSAYKDMRGHRHNDPKAALPLFRLMTWIDPQFIPGWTTGAVIMARDRTETADRQAFAFLQEGLRQNPESLAILSDMGRMCAVHFHDLKTATVFLTKACELGAKHFDHLPDVEREGLNQSVRWLSLCYRDLGMPQEQQKVLEFGLRLFPDDLFLFMAKDPPPSIMSRRAQIAWAQDQMKKR